MSPWHTCFQITCPQGTFLLLYRYINYLTARRSEQLPGKWVLNIDQYCDSTEGNNSVAIFFILLYLKIWWAILNNCCILSAKIKLVSYLLQGIQLQKKINTWLFKLKAVCYIEAAHCLKTLWQSALHSFWSGLNIEIKMLYWSI